MVDFQFVTERVAVGGAINTLDNMRRVAEAGITHVIDMQLEFDDRSIADGTGVQVLWMECPDDFLPKPNEMFWEGALFAMAALEDPQGRILIHCAAGIHRGPMMTFAILRVMGYGREDALSMISSARPQAEFPDVYVESVEDFVREYLAAEQEEQGIGNRE
ncbi:MAG: dual specificity protein phosphatase family protein [Acidobacteria bacterium]|nr:dual specificity protein phosphatase family protein [Acidobacteriota bacterium]